MEISMSNSICNISNGGAPCLDLLNKCVNERENGKRAELRIFPITTSKTQVIGIKVKCITVSKIKVTWDAFLHSIGIRENRKHGTLSWSSPKYAPVIRQFIQVSWDFIENGNAKHDQRLALTQELFELFSDNRGLTTTDKKDIQLYKKIISCNRRYQDQIQTSPESSHTTSSSSHRVRFKETADIYTYKPS